ncbi:DUF1127 domain-containing protein [Microvirga massiliensis]|uniref:DUF1127 domain-containing protein n=1 Tax=Microvirga massiliensis TaxID=1033741 RepID=UPI00062B7777|nr:DUF1127 domain-containing protein [Microvirga massiliensis]
MSSLSHAVVSIPFAGSDAHGSGIGVKRLAAHFIALLTEARRRVALHRARRELFERPDDLLKDMGLARSEIAWVVEHGRFGHASRK